MARKRARRHGRELKLKIAKQLLLLGGAMRQEIANQLGLEFEVVDAIAKRLRLRERSYDYYRNPNPWAA